MNAVENWPSNISLYALIFTSIRDISIAGIWKSLVASRLFRMFLTRCTVSNMRYIYFSGFIRIG